jgi:hypothetical protein
MERYLTKAVKETLGDKFILLMGPRQVGKTTLAKSIDPDGAYYNYDIRKDWKVFHEQDWDYSKKLIIFDELHKMKNNLSSLLAARNWMSPKKWVTHWQVDFGHFA